MKYISFFTPAVQDIVKQALFLFTQGCICGWIVKLERKTADAAIIDGKKRMQPYSNKLSSAR